MADGDELDLTPPELVLDYETQIWLSENFQRLQAIAAAAEAERDVNAAALSAHELLKHAAHGGDIAWIAATLLNNWGSLGSPWGAPAYRKFPGNLVLLRGGLQADVATANVAFTLPAGYRPGNECKFICSDESSGAGSNAFAVSVQVDGDVYVENLSANFDPILSPILFFAEA
jgi:hypothetical protein